MAPLVMHHESWLGFLDDCGFLKSSDAHSNVGHEMDLDDAVLCFVWSQDFVSDEIRRSQSLQTLSFVGFLEAIARLTLFIQLPTRADLESHNLSTLEELYEGIEKGEFPLEELRGQVGHEPNWQTEESSSASLAEPLDMLIRLISCRLDKDGDHTVDVEELKRSKADRQAKRQRQAKAALTAKLQYDREQEAAKEQSRHRATLHGRKDITAEADKGT